MTLLVTGLVRGELTVLLWGGAFGFVAAYAGVVGGLVRWRMAKGPPTGRLAALEGGVLEFRTDDRPPAAALLTWSLVLEGIHSPGRRWAARCPLQLVSRSPGPSLRGVYAVTASWELTDWFGFVRWRPRHRWETTVTVVGGEHPWRPAFRPEARSGPIRARRTGRRAGDPFDVRRYVAGDDLRRLHWPLYAHAGTLFVRTADPSPPPEGRWRLVLDLTADDEAALDARLALVAGWLGEVGRTGGSWTLEAPGAGGVSSAEEGLLAFLAGLSPRPLDPAALALPPGVRLVTGPRTPAARSTLPLVVLPEPAAPGSERRTWWSRRSEAPE